MQDPHRRVAAEIVDCEIGDDIGGYGTVRNRKELRPVFQRREHALIGAGQPGLSAKSFNFLEQSLAPQRIQMRCNFVQKQEGRKAATGVFHRFRMSENEADQQGLLLARRAQMGRHVLGAVAHQEIGAMRSRQRAPGRAVTLTGYAELTRIPVLDRKSVV